MSKEAMKLALDALQKIYIAPEHEEYIRVWWPACEQAITALREALANEALDKMAENARELGLDYEPACKTGSQCTSKCQQCEQPAQQEPVAWLSEGGNFSFEPWQRSIPLYTSPPAQKEDK